MTEGVDYFVYLVPLPLSVGGFVRPNDDGTYSVYLNNRLTHLANLRSCRHETAHLAHGDFYRAASVDEMERDAG